jgi:DNA-binding MarR family transcriptional regulator
MIRLYDDKKGLTPERLRAIELMLSGWSGKQIAKELHVDPATVCRWKKSKVVQDILHDHLVGQIAAVDRKIKESALVAIEYLRAVIEGPMTPTGERVHAAIQLLKLVQVDQDELAKLRAENAEIRDKLEKLAVRQDLKAIRNGG